MVTGDEAFRLVAGPQHRHHGWVALFLGGHVPALEIGTQLLAVTPQV